MGLSLMQAGFEPSTQCRRQAIFSFFQMLKSFRRSDNAEARGWNFSLRHDTTEKLGKKRSSPSTPFDSGFFLHFFLRVYVFLHVKRGTKLKGY
jgi:hypothetical protein